MNWHLNRLNVEWISVVSLSVPMDIRCIRRIVTWHEKYVYYRNTDVSKQWLGPVNLPKSSFKKKLVRPRIKLCARWNFEDVIHWEVVPNWRAVDPELYSQELERVHEILRRRYPALVNRNRILLQQDNARPNTARTTMTNIQKFRGIELLPHPSYSRDLAPSDYQLFRSMAHFLRRRNFENTEAVEVGLTEFFASKTRGTRVAPLYCQSTSHT